MDLSQFNRQSWPSKGYLLFSSTVSDYKSLIIGHLFSMDTWFLYSIERRGKWLMVYLIYMHISKIGRNCFPTYLLEFVGIDFQHIHQKIVILFFNFTSLCVQFYISSSCSLPFGFHPKTQAHQKHSRGRKGSWKGYCF